MLSVRYRRTRTCICAILYVVIVTVVPQLSSPHLSSMDFEAAELTSVLQAKLPPSPVKMSTHMR